MPLQFFPSNKPLSLDDLAVGKWFGCSGPHEETSVVELYDAVALETEGPGRKDKYVAFWYRDGEAGDENKAIASASVTTQALAWGYLLRGDVLVVKVQSNAVAAEPAGVSAVDYSERPLFTPLWEFQTVRKLIVQ